MSAPTRAAINLGVIAIHLCGPDNYERWCLSEMLDALTNDPPDMDTARAAVRDGLDHAYRDGFTETRVEVQFLAEANRCLGGVQ